MNDVQGDGPAPTPETGYLLVFDGPAHEQRIHMAVPPGPIRWFCRSGEMGSDDTIEWWVTADVPPEDPAVEITEYRLNPDQEPRADEETGDFILEFTCDDTKWLGRTLGDGGLHDHQEQEPPQPEIPRASFRAEDIAAMLVNGEWIEVDSAGKMYEVLIEPNDGPVKISTGPNLVFEDREGSWVSISPQMVHGFRFRPSSVAQKPHLTPDGTLRVSRDTFDAADAEVQAMVSEAMTVVIVEPNGEHVVEKQPS